MVATGDVASRQERRADCQGGLVRRWSLAPGELAEAYDQGRDLTVPTAYGSVR